MAYQPHNNNLVSTVNSSTAALDSAAVFTGTWEDASKYDSVVAALSTDQNGTFQIQFSPDGTNADSTLTSYYKTTAINPPHRFTVTRKYVRVVFTNTSASDQTYFRLQVTYGNHVGLNLPTDSAMAQSFDATVVRPTDYGLDVARGIVGGVTFINKFGRNPATAAGDAIWANSNAYTEPATAEQCNVVSTSTDDDGSPAGTGARTISITGIDENYDIVTETVTMNGTTDVLTTNSYWNIHRAYVVTAGTDSGAVGTITITSTAAGTPVVATLSIGYNQTQSTVYMVPRNYTAYVNLPNVIGQNTTANALCDIGCFKKDFGGVFRILMDFNLTGGSTAYIPKAFGVPFKLDAKTTVLFKAISVSGGGTWDVSVDYDIWLVADQA